MSRLYSVVWFGIFCLLLCGGQSSANAQSMNLQGETIELDLPQPGKKWAVLYQGRPNQTLQKLPASIKAVPLKGLMFQGPHQGHPFLLGEFESKGKWNIIQGGLQRATMQDALLGLAEVEDFQADIGLNAEGLGGWLIVLGWSNGHGYILYNVTLKESGSPWHVCEFRDAKAILETDREIQRYVPTGNQSLQIEVKNQQLNVKLGNQVLANRLEIENYSKGMLAIGTYDTRYQAKPLRLYGIRVRSLSE